LNLTAMQAAITGAGHFLGEADTLARMNSDFLYPQIGDRRSIEEWQDEGALTVWDRAHEQVRAILDAPPVAVIASDTSDKIARQFGLPLLGAC
jgi:trimethylamine--corrinoid protein Co-methyltransferase